jgi:hypothetical protein
MQNDRSDLRTETATGIRRTEGVDGSTIAPPLAVRDCLLVCLVLLASVVPYIAGLGFYSDDWVFLASLGKADGGSLRDAFDAVNVGNARMRPVQSFYLALMYHTFGRHPLPYHLVNAAVFCCIAVLLYLTLRELRVWRGTALAVALVYPLLPNYGTDRFWLAAFHIPLGVALYLLSVYTLMRALRAESRGAAWGWKGVSLLSFTLGALAYEVVLPLVVVNLLLTAWFLREARTRDGHPPPPVHLPRPVVWGGDLAAAALVVAYKVQTNTRPDPPMALAERVIHALRVCKYAVIQDFGFYGIKLPIVLWRALHTPGILPTALWGTFVAALVAGYVFRAAAAETASWPGGKTTVGFMVAGLLLFFAGYAVFFVTVQIQFSPTGIANRVAIAAALGVALLFVGLASGLSPFIGRAPERAVLPFSLLIGFLFAAGFIINSAVARYWMQAWPREQTVLARIQEDVPPLPKNGVLLLDGSCPYIGPAVVFESSWDLQGALAVARRDYTLRADVVTPALQIDEAGVTTWIYNKPTRYPYGDLFVYDLSRRTVSRLRDFASARAYFAYDSPNRGDACPAGEPGKGVPIF